MKIYFVLLFLIAQSLYSQANTGWGFKFGVNMPNIDLANKSAVSSGDVPLIKTSNKIGISGGFFADVYEFKGFVLSSELSYRQMHTEAEITYFGNSYKADYLIEYITPGLIAKYLFGGNAIKPYVSTGINMNIYAGDNPSSSAGNIDDATKTELSENLKKVYLTIPISAGIQIKTNEKFSILIEALFMPAIFRFYEDADRTGKANTVELKAGGKFVF